jgi:hypothetical protein
MPKNLRIVDEFEKLAKKKGCTSSQLALAWVAAQGAIPIPGTKNKDRLVENFGAREFDLDDYELNELRVLIEDAKPTGDRSVPSIPRYKLLTVTQVQCDLYEDGWPVRSVFSGISGLWGSDGICTRSNHGNVTRLAKQGVMLSVLAGDSANHIEVLLVLMPSSRRLKNDWCATALSDCSNPPLSCMIFGLRSHVRYLYRGLV